MDNIRPHWNGALLALGTLVLVAGCSSTPATTAVQPTGLQTEQASIPFARMDDSIHDWQANGEDGLWVQDARRNWYYATMLGPCYGLDWAIAIGFEPGAGGTLDRFSSVLVPRYRSRCPFSSFVRSDPPPQNVKQRHATQEEADKAGAPPPRDASATERP